MPLPSLFLFPISTFLTSSPFLLDSGVGVQLPLQSSQPLLTHCALAGWSILASCSASSAEQGSNWNSSSNGGPCSKMDRHKYTHLWEQCEAAAEGIPCSRELDYEMILFFLMWENSGLSLSEGRTLHVLPPSQQWDGGLR